MEDKKMKAEMDSKPNTFCNRNLPMVRIPQIQYKTMAIIETGLILPSVVFKIFQAQSFITRSRKSIVAFNKISCPVAL
jgi:hypothetical protein